MRIRLAVIVAIAVVVAVVLACVRPVPRVAKAPRATLQPAAVATLSFEPTGIVWCGIVPDWTCTHFIQVVGPDDVVHEGWFDNPPSASPMPTHTLVGDVPTRLVPGAYRVTFLKQRVSDISSEVPVPGGTPRLTNGSDVFATCETAFRVTGPADIRVAVAFGESSCTATTNVTSPP